MKMNFTTWSRSKLKGLIYVLVLVAVIALLNGCGQEKPGEVEGEPVATIEMADGQKIVVALYPQYAPNTVNNFIELSEAGFYNGLTFHRIIAGFMIQGGDPEGIGMGGPGYGIPGEFKDNGFENNLKHEPGVISMARAQDYNSGGSQFFICHGETSFLDNQYAAFGKVIEGMSVVDQIAQSEVDANDMPITPVVIKAIKIDRGGYVFDSVEKVK